MYSKGLPFLRYSSLPKLFCNYKILIVEVLLKLREALKALGSIYHPSGIVPIQLDPGYSPATVGLEYKHEVNAVKLLQLQKSLRMLLPMLLKTRQKEHRLMSLFLQPLQLPYQLDGHGTESEDNTEESSLKYYHATMFFRTKGSNLTYRIHRQRYM
ncbi:hypothetical protein AVEN_172945-1 [Araneus ventricosus]|uniref:Uncharacterized protein n=1 Tax=Araneus ventricosus TaxID=182803 RepID=A0A4Y2S6Z8_ARAVE|nr:hypothetical protein AVEN_2899-1 [Araneus ventricosus]GBN83366.1 hypothetical protein AVEN_172945-1 [Araneus ventricosus]